MFASVKIIGMTGGTGARVIKLERDVGLVLPVTRDTTDIGIVVTRVITVVRMIIIHWCPARGSMTGDAIFTRLEMTITFPRCIIAIVTGLAIARYTRVIPCRTDKCCRCVAV